MGEGPWYGVRTVSGEFLLVDVTTSTYGAFSSSRLGLRVLGVLVPSSSTDRLAVVIYERLHVVQLGEGGLNGALLHLMPQGFAPGAEWLSPL